MRDADELFRLYMNAVGGNATFLLNVPPDARGHIAKPDREALQGLGRHLERLADMTLTRKASMRVSSARAGRGIGAEDGLEAATAEFPGNGWQPEADDQEPWIELSFAAPVRLDTVSLGEHLPAGQRIEAFEVRIPADEAATDSKSWQPISQGRIVGYRNIRQFAPVRTSRIRIVFTRYREFPTLDEVRVYSFSDQSADLSEIQADSKKPDWYKEGTK
ncbi:hypothetical protein [Saccharibacillus qingshengii]|uniref:hypothetical protein n=1 Tax=Saccharibacillus qingshengii TaxID=1763540 RepID=UPI0031B5A606